MMTKNGKITWTNERRKLSDLIPWDINPATISKDAAKRLEESLDEFGQVETIAISPNNEIYDGHQRQVVWGASSKFGADYVVDVRVSSRELTEHERKKLVIFLRKGTVGQFDFDMLANNWELEDLLEWGFDKKELDIDLWAGSAPEDPGAQIDKAEELRVKWGVESGQLWKLGEHRLICGDCTDRAVVEKVMQGEKARLFITDPPYGVSYADKNRFLNAIGRPNSIEKPIDGDHQTVPEMADLWLAAFITVYEYCDSGCPYYIFSPQGGELMMMMMMMMMIEKAGYLLKHSIIWVKNQFVIGRSDYHYKHEPILYGWKDGGHKFYGDAGECSVWQVDKPHDSDDHPTSKPVILYEKAIKNSSQPNEIIIEPFVGSGTGIIACERLHRKCRAVEISPAYCAVAIQRWVDMTGGIPELLE